MILNPESKFQWVSTESDQVRGVWRNLSSIGNERSRLSKMLGCKKGWGFHMPHTVSCFKEIYLLCHNLPAQYFWFFWFLSTGNCTRLLVCMYLLRIIMLNPESYSGDLGSDSISASRRQRMRLSILEEDCKIAFSSHSVFSSLRFLLMGKKVIFKRKNLDVS